MMMISEACNLILSGVAIESPHKKSIFCTQWDRRSRIVYFSNTEKSGSMKIYTQQT